jgi:acetylglutamate kinase
MTVLKLGGELFEAADARNRIADLIAAIDGSLVIVHGGGKAIDAELARRNIQPKKVDGLRITDADTLDAVIAVLAGSANTSLVAALVARGVKAVGLTGVDAGLGRAQIAPPLRATSGEIVDLGLVGDPTEADPALIRTLTGTGYVPVIACLGVDDAGRVLNVNADVMACRIAAALKAELLIAGTTPGVFDASGGTIPTLDVDGMDALIASGAANAGMVAKLNACRVALESGVPAVKIVDGSDLKTGTTLVAGVRA